MYNRKIRVHLIDTPGFDDTDRSDVEVLQDIAHWLSASFKEGIRLSGIVYIHRISDPRMAGSSRRNLVMFKKLCGEKAYQSVVLATSMWSRVSEDEGRERERQLIETDDFWGHMCKQGSRVFRYLNTQQSALELVGYILSMHSKVTLDIQDEMVIQGHEIDETSAAHELNAEIIRERNRYNAKLAAAKEEMKQAMLDRDEEMQRFYKEEIDGFQDKLRKTAAEQQKLTQSLEDVEKRKEEEFRAFREELMKEHQEERARYQQERDEYRKSIRKQEETIRQQQLAEEQRMREQQASREEMERRHAEFQRTMEEQRREHEVRIREMDENHRRVVADLEERGGRRPPSKSFFPVVTEVEDGQMLTCCHQGGFWPRVGWVVGKIFGF